MKASVENLASKQIHENSETSEENSQAQKEELKDTGEHDGVAAEIVAFLNVNAVHLAV